ncbi:hypothetical protein A3Q56_01973 [Intoshia linei]|uniref:Uncharacterized protein n=1 Tax=Intoshia linei TaxID=1819745 RepID=A0A177B7Q0_9BILA|nr:hypothetical protein A3Q56_01973 [Intoshia linei]
MAEAHSAVAFSFSITPEGPKLKYNNHAFIELFASSKRSLCRDYATFRNRIRNNSFPFAPSTLLLSTGFVASMQHINRDVSFGAIKLIENKLTLFSKYCGASVLKYSAGAIYASAMWAGAIIMVRFILRKIFSYQDWIYQIPKHGVKPSLKTKIWFLILSVVKYLVPKKPLLNSYQHSLPRLPVPSLESTINRYLLSVKHLKSEEDYDEITKLANDFKNGHGRKIQLYLKLKAFVSINYVTDWWEEYVYLSNRDPIMINSNYYGTASLNHNLTKYQSARAASLVINLFNYRRSIVSESLEPLIKFGVPLCSSQYDRTFNTTRIPGKTKDKIVHYKDSRHFVVIHAGRYYKIYAYHHCNGNMFSAAQIELMLDKILNDTDSVNDSELKLGSLTAGNRDVWYHAREHMLTNDVNSYTLACVEKAAFVLILDDELCQLDGTTGNDYYTRYAKLCLHGKGYDRWFDKSICYIVFKDTQIGFVAEHSWADAPIAAQMQETIIFEDYFKGYDTDGHCFGKAEAPEVGPIRIHWKIDEKLTNYITQSFNISQSLIDDTDMYVIRHDAVGVNTVKSFNISPDAFIQMALQYSYYKHFGAFCNTYEASMTRLFAEGRTETCRSCTKESVDFVMAMVHKQPLKVCYNLFKKATDNHQRMYQDCMTGKGIDRHLFCLYVMSRYLKMDSPFLNEALLQPKLPWNLSTSQTPIMVKRKFVDRREFSVSPGGGFGPCFPNIKSLIVAHVLRELTKLKKSPFF